MVNLFTPLLLPSLHFGCNDMRRNEYDQIGLRVGHVRLAKRVTDDRYIAQERRSLLRFGRLSLDQAADNKRIAVFDHDTGLSRFVAKTR